MTEEECNKSWWGEHWRQAIAMIVIFAGIGMMVTYGVANVIPYDDARAEWDGELITDEETSAGVAVIRVGEMLQYRIDFCNEGVDILAERWFDSFGDVSETADIPRTDDELSSSTYDTDTFFPITESATGCFDDILITQPVSPFISPGAYYSVRNETTFYPNFLAEGHFSNRSELFYYAEVGEDLP